MELEGKVALVTGASRGIGRAIALGMAREGAKVGVHYNTSRDRAQEVLTEVQNLGSQGILVQADLSQFKDIDKAVALLYDAFGRIDSLVNNAGCLRRVPFLDLTLEDVSRTFATNFQAPFFLSQRVIPRMLQAGSGNIIFVGSDIVSHPKVDMSMDYGASKQALVYLMRSLAVTYAPHIRVNAVLPGFTLTEMSSAYGNEIKKTEIERGIPLGRINYPEDIAEMVLFLASVKARNITGQSFVIDGGRSLQ